VLIALIGVINYLAWILTVIVIVQFVMSLLISFNVINLHNNGVAAIWQALNALLEPILRPVRRILPNTGAIDFSPLVVIIGLNILSMLLGGLANDLRY
jgi:YggT family protein